MDPYVERRPGDGLQWVRPPRRTRPRENIYYVERRRQVRNTIGLPVRDNELWRRELPSFEVIERLLATYVATGGGTGDYLAALDAQVKEHGYDDELDPTHTRRSYLSSRYPSRRYSASSSSSSDDGHDQAGPSPRRPSGGPPDKPHVEIIDYEESVAHGQYRERMRRPGRSSHHPPVPWQAYVEDVLEDEDDEPIYTPLPPEEDDRRTRSMRATHTGTLQSQELGNSGRHILILAPEFGGRRARQGGLAQRNSRAGSNRNEHTRRAGTENPRPLRSHGNDDQNIIIEEHHVRVEGQPENRGADMEAQSR